MAKQKIKVIREEMLQVANNVAQEKSIDKDSVFEAMEMALEKAARVKYGFERDIRVTVNRENGDINLNSYLEVVESLSEENQVNQIILEEAIKINPEIKIGIHCFLFTFLNEIHRKGNNDIDAINKRNAAT